MIKRPVLACRLLVLLVGGFVLFQFFTGISNAISFTSLDEILQDFHSRHPGGAVVVKNLTDDTESSINPSKKFTSASLYKLYVAQHLFEQKKAGKLSFTEPIPLEDVAGQHSENVADCQNSQSCIKAIWPSVPTGQSATINQCLPKMIIYSDNICGKTFLDYTRETIGKYPGYQNTTMSPLQTSANDVAILLSNIANHKWVDEDSSRQIYDLLKQQYHREKIPAGLPGGIEVANKTGEIHSASSGKSHDAAIIKTGSKVYVLVVLTNKNPDLPATKEAFSDLSKQVYDFVNSGTATTNPSGSRCAPEAVAIDSSIENERSVYSTLSSPFYEPNADLCCEANSGGPADGGPLTGVHFPEVQDTAIFVASIKKYIQKGWPTSPLIDYADDFVRLGQKYDVNPAIPAVIAQVEFQFGTLPQVQKGGPNQYNFWAVTRDTGNGERFGPYDSIDQAMEDHYRVLSGKRGPPYTYIGPPQNFTTVRQIMLQYAPPGENDTDRYIQTILDGMKKLLTDGGVGGDNQLGESAVFSDGCVSTEATGNSGVVSADGYAFPIAATKKGDISSFSNALNLLPCNNSSGCHHADGYARGGYAFDLGVTGYGPDRSENAPVYAISNGIVVTAKYSRNGNRCNQLQFKSDKDGYVYWYGHLKYDTSIKAGQRYKAGQEIGKVGPTACADDTAPHLHIDRGYPKGAMGGLTDHRDEGIIPLINKLYESLPE